MDDKQLEIVQGHRDARHNHTGQHRYYLSQVGRHFKGVFYWQS
jgi:hypothetical protein